MDPKQKLIAIAVGSVCGLIILALAVLLVLQIGHMNEARAARDNAEATINNYYAAKPYPSEDNRAVRKQDETARAGWADKARAVLTHGLQVPQGESPSQFVQRIGDAVRGLNARQETAVAAAGQQQVMDYSFGRYVVQGAIPKDADVPRLAPQFAVVEHVCDLLLDNGARAITAVTREEFDAAAAKPEEEEPRTRRRRRRAEEEEPAAAVGAAIDPILAKDGVRRESYTIAFSAPYVAIAKTLNALAVDDLFVVVTDLSVDATSSVAASVDELIKKRQSAKSNAARRAASSRAAAQKQAAAPASETSLFEGASPAERLVTDPAHAAPLRAVLSFDVYSAAPAQAPAAPAETKKGN